MAKGWEPGMAMIWIGLYPVCCSCSSFKGGVKLKSLGLSPSSEGRQLPGGSG